MKKNILVIAAHPDDEILGCGATIYKHSKDGDNVFVLILGAGVESRYKKGLNNGTIIKKKNVLYKESLRAHKILKIKKSFFEYIADNRFDSVELLDLVKILENYIKKLKPNIIYTHSYKDLNIDHRLIFESVLTATRPKINEHIDLFSFEIPSSTDWAFGYKTSFNPNYFINVEKEFNFKMRALKCYKSEMRKFPHSRSLENVDYLSKVRGAMIGCKKAEAFEVIKIYNK